jgi:hypothetical protein
MFLQANSTIPGMQSSPERQRAPSTPGLLLRRDTRVTQGVTLVRLVRALLGAAIVVAGALGAFAIYTWGWHAQASTTRISRLDSNVAALQTRVHALGSELTLLQARTKGAKNSDQMALESCFAYRTFRRYHFTGDPGVDYVVKLMRYFASVCDDSAVPESHLTPAGHVVPNVP